jgi:hypothetical protein
VKREFLFNSTRIKKMKGKSSRMLSGKTVEEKELDQITRKLEFLIQKKLIKELK